MGDSGGEERSRSREEKEGGREEQRKGCARSKDVEAEEGLTWQQEAVVDDGEEVWVGQGVTGLPLQHVKHTLQVGRVYLNLVRDSDVIIEGAVTNNTYLYIPHIFFEVRVSI